MHPRALLDRFPPSINDVKSMTLRNILLRKFKSRKINPIVLLIGWPLLFGACTTPYHNPHLPGLASSSQYFSTAEDYTAAKKVYDGFYQTMEFSATLLNSKVTRDQLDHKARIYQWTQDQYSTAKAEAETSLSRETRIFLSFFVPERKHDDLSKANTTWKIFLDAGGRRYEGKATKIKSILADVVSLYPAHNRFSTPYMVSFPVSVSQIENVPSRLTLTGPVGSTTVEFDDLK